MKKKRRKYLGSMTIDTEVEVEIAELLNELSTEDLVEELIERGQLFGDPGTRDYALQALEALVAGRRGAAIALLDRALFPTDKDGKETACPLSAWLTFVPTPSNQETKQ